MTKVITALLVVPFLLGMGPIPTSQAAKVTAALADASQSAVSTNLGIYGGDNWDIAVDGDHVYTIANGVPNGFFYSADAAATWQRPAGVNDYGAGFAVEVDPATHTVFVSLGGGLYRSTDYGVTLSGIASNAGFPLLYAQSRLLYASNDVVYVSADNGTTFTSAAIGGSENVQSFAASKTAGTFYAATRNASTSASHLYVSTDYGVTWAAMTVDASVTSYTSVNASPNDAGTLTLSGDNDLWLSLNAGTSWTKMGVTPSRSCGNFSVWTATRWYACAGYSTDNGTTWTDMDTHTNVMRGPGKIVVINAADTDVMYGDCMSGVCKSTNGGLTWTNSLDGITAVNVLGISQTTDKSTVWISSSNGLGKTSNFTSASPTWTWPILPCDPLTRCDSSGIGESVWVKPDNASIVLAGSIGGWVYRSTNAGTSWTAQIPAVVDLAKFKTGSYNNLRPKHFISDPNDPTVVYLAMYDPIDNNGAVLKSTDSGATWTDMAIADDAPATTLSMTKSGVLYAGTGYSSSTLKGVYKYEGGVWSKLVGINTTLNINSVMVDPETQTTVYASGTGQSSPAYDAFYKSVDSGATWTAIDPGGYHGYGAITVQRSTSPNTLYLSAIDNAGHGLLLKSSDAGATWALLYQGLKSESYTTVLFDGLVAGNKHGVFSMKSKAKFTNYKISATKVKKNSKVTVTGILKDAATKKLLKNKTLGLYQLQSNKKWKLIGTVKTNSKAAFTAKVKVTKNATYRVGWTPSKADKEEYTSYYTANFTLKTK